MPTEILIRQTYADMRGERWGTSLLSKIEAQEQPLTAAQYVAPC